MRREIVERPQIRNRVKNGLKSYGVYPVLRWNCPLTLDLMSLSLAANFDNAALLLDGLCLDPVKCQMKAH